MILLTDEEIHVPNLIPPKDDPDLYLRIGRMNNKAQLGKDIETIKAMPHGTTHCDIVRVLQEGLE